MSRSFDFCSCCIFSFYVGCFPIICSLIGWWESGFNDTLEVWKTGKNADKGEEWKVLTGSVLGKRWLVEERKCWQTGEEVWRERTFGERSPVWPVWLCLTCVAVFEPVWFCLTCVVVFLPVWLCYILCGFLCLSVWVTFCVRS